jgi:hypothetical protein
MNSLGIRARRALVDDYAPFQRLQALDAIASDVSESGPFAGGDQAATLLKDIDSLLGTCIEKARNLRQHVNEHPDIVSEVLQILLAETTPDPAILPLGDDARRYWEDQLRTFEGEGHRLFDAVFSRLADHILPEEREAVRQRIERLSAGEEVEADFVNPCTNCGIGMAGALVYGAVGLFVIGIPLAAAAGAFCGYHRCLW